MQELSPAPRFPKAWSAPAAAGHLLDLVLHSRAGFVRSWATALLKDKHAEFLRERTAGDIARLLSHADEQVQAFGAACLEMNHHAPHWPVDQWLSLLESPNPTVLATVCAAMERHIRAENLSLSQCVELACAKATPVARMGLGYLQQRPITSDDDRLVMVNLAQAHCPAVASEIAKWAMPFVTAESQYDAGPSWRPTRPQRSR